MWVWAVVSKQWSQNLGLTSGEPILGWKPDKQDKKLYYFSNQQDKLLSGRSQAKI